jgi:hypothetical protein
MPINYKIVQVLALASLIFSAISFSTISPVQHAASASPSQPDVAPVTDYFGRFQLDPRPCERSGTRVVCDILVTNLTAKTLDQWFRASSGHPSTIAGDVEGNQYVAKSVRIGEAESTWFVASYLVPCIPVKVSFVFDIPQSVNQLAILNIAHRDGTVALCNISIGSSSPAAITDSVCKACQQI